ncbi:MAG TPA: Crp/Fnr family transcriptional regulator [Blastocatellia bacterium]|nr:Crp/Fnr family transcriptional regulator [Blastocatellia bacterium]
MSNSESAQQIENRIILNLTPADREQLLPHLEPIHLAFGRVLYNIGAPVDYVYFHNRGMSSLISYTQEGGNIEVGMVGYEGVTGLQAFLGPAVSEHHAVMQLADDSHRLPADLFKQACGRLPSLQAVVLRYTHSMMTQLTQSVVCSRFHSIEQRLCRWLLTSQDAVRSDDIRLTQEFLAAMLGVNRPGVTIAARLIQNTGMIEYSRGRIRILDRQGLEAASCECYAVINRAFKWLYPA